MSSGAQQITKLWDKDKNLIVEQNQLLNLIAYYHEELYSSRNPKPSNIINRSITNIGSEDVPEITKIQIKTALNQTSTGRSPGKDLCANVKGSEATVIGFLLDVFNKYLE